MESDVITPNGKKDARHSRFSSPRSLNVIVTNYLLFRGKMRHLGSDRLIVIWMKYLKEKRLMKTMFVAIAFVCSGAAFAISSQADAIAPTSVAASALEQQELPDCND